VFKNLADGIQGRLDDYHFWAERIASSPVRPGQFELQQFRDMEKDLDKAINNAMDKFLGLQEEDRVIDRKGFDLTDKAKGDIETTAIAIVTMEDFSRLVADNEHLVGFLKDKSPIRSPFFSEEDKNTVAAMRSLLSQVNSLYIVLKSGKQVSEKEIQFVEPAFLNLSNPTRSTVNTQLLMRFFRQKLTTMTTLNGVTNEFVQGILNDIREVDVNDYLSNLETREVPSNPEDPDDDGHTRLKPLFGNVTP